MKKRSLKFSSLKRVMNIRRFRNQKKLKTSIEREKWLRDTKFNDLINYSNYL